MASISSTSVGGVRIYNLAAGKSLPEWLVAKSRDKLRRDDDFKRHVELLQGFDFPTASQRIRETNNGQFCIATGTYPPQIRCYDYSQLTIKWKRHLDCEVVQFVSFMDDWTKIALLENDRHVEFHSQGGTYFKARIPKFGRDMAYDPMSCDLLFATSGSEIYRLNLDQGRFLAPFVDEEHLAPPGEEGFNCVHIGEATGLIAVGGDAGIVQCWDSRTRKPAGLTNVRARIADATFGVDTHSSVTSVKFDSNNWLSMAVGTDTGHVAMYDLRMEAPHQVKDHQNGTPIIHVDYVSGEENRMLSADSQAVKFWNKDSGKTFTTIETGNEIADVCVVKGSGLVYVAGEQQRMGTFFIPQLGTAPKWCTFLENLTEELEDAPATVYDDFKFVTKEEMSQIGLEHLIGSNMLRAYMHGYFIDVKLYNRAKSITDPFAFEAYKKKLIDAKVDRERETRISLKRRVPRAKVNKELAERLSLDKDKNKLLEDDRFKGLFDDAEYQIDEANDDYQRLHAGGVRKQATISDVDESDNEMLPGIFDEVEEKPSAPYQDSSSEGEEEVEVPARKPKEKKMFKIAQGTDFDWSKQQEERRKEHAIPLGRRADDAGKKIARTPGRSIHTMSFTPTKRKAQSDRALAEMAHNKEARTRKRRDIKSLKLPGEHARHRRKK